MIRHIPKNKLTTTNWSGGTTTQLFIYPENSSYAERNFIFRISTATVEQEESVFTSLPGVHRHLMILEGNLHIKHINHYEKTLRAFDQDEFEGEWTTHGKGKVKDFNVMLRENAKARITAISLRGKEYIECGSRFSVLYLYQGMMMVNHIELKQGDVLIAEGKEQLEIISMAQSKIILTDIWS